MLIESYADFARVYDSLMDDIDYDVWATHYMDILREQGCKPKFLVDLGCGTGSMTLALAKKGMDVIGLDRSEDMLMMARDKALQAKREDLLFVQMDIRDFSLPMPADALICANDVINYLLLEEDLQRFFSCAYAWLKPGAGLVFDISTPHKLQNMHGQVYYDDRDELTLLWNNAMKGDVLFMELAVFCREKDGRYSRFDEQHEQRVWGQDLLTTMLQQTGFSDIHIYGGQEMRPPMEEDERIHFFARK